MLILIGFLHGVVRQYLVGNSISKLKRCWNGVVNEKEMRGGR